MSLHIAMNLGLQIPIPSINERVCLVLNLGASNRV
jgi:hypothetical protein